MSYFLSQVAYVGFTTNGTDGAAANADSTPTASLVRNGSADGAVAVTVTNLSTGAYLASFTCPSDYSVGDDLQLLVSATIGGTAAKKFVGRDVVDSTVNSRSTYAGGDTSGTTTLLSRLTSTRASNLDNLDQAVSQSQPFGVIGLRIKVDEGTTDYLEGVAGDTVTTELFFVDGDGHNTPILADFTASMLDAGGDEVGDTTVSDSHAASGYISLSLDIPSSGNKPATLRIAFTGGSTYDVTMRVWS